MLRRPADLIEACDIKATQGHGSWSGEKNWRPIYFAHSGTSKVVVDVHVHVESGLVDQDVTPDGVVGLNIQPAKIR